MSKRKRTELQAVRFDLAWAYGLIALAVLGNVWDAHTATETIVWLAITGLFGFSAASEYRKSRR